MTVNKEIVVLKLNNPDFNRVEFDTVKNQSGSRKIS